MIAQDATANLTAEQIVAALRLRHRAKDQWVFVPELRFGTGYGGDAERRIDAWALHCWPSSGLLSVAYEVKISRSDFLHELRQPLKRRPGLLVSNAFYFATPPGMLHPQEVPPECGLVEVWGPGLELPFGLAQNPHRQVVTGKSGWSTAIVVPAPQRDRLPPPWRFVASALRRMQDRQGGAASREDDE